VTPVFIEPDPYQRALKDMRLAREELREANDRIKRLEAAGDAMERWCSDYQTAFNWEKAKEAKP
jgi:hypothetical protein